MPEGCLMGSGAEASEVPLPLVSICSAVDTSMGCSAELPGASRDGQPVSVGPRGQQSPPTNFTGLWKRDMWESEIIPLSFFLWWTFVWKVTEPSCVAQLEVENIPRKKIRAKGKLLCVWCWNNFNKQCSNSKQISRQLCAWQATFIWNSSK